MAAVFVSYCRESHEKARSLAQDLDALGHKAWFDQALTGGQSWWNHILDEIQKCDVFAFLLEQESLDSAACKREYLYAARLGKSVLPVLIGEDVDAALLPDALAQIHFVDYRREDRDAFRSLAKALAALPPSPPLPDPLPEPPPAPVSYLGSLREQLEAPDGLTFSEQTGLVLRLKNGLRNPKDADQVRTLLRLFRRRDDLYAKVADEIDALLTDASGSPPAPVAEPKDSAPPNAPEVVTPLVPENTPAPDPLPVPPSAFNLVANIDRSQPKPQESAASSVKLFSIQHLLLSLLGGTLLALASDVIMGSWVKPENLIYRMSWAIPSALLFCIGLVWQRLSNRSIFFKIAFVFLPLAIAGLANLPIYMLSSHDPSPDEFHLLAVLLQMRFLVALVPIALVAAVLSQSKVRPFVLAWPALVVGVFVSGILVVTLPRSPSEFFMANILVAIAFVVFGSVMVGRKFSAKRQ